MPQIQVINRQEDPTVQGIRNFGASVQSGMQQQIENQRAQQALKLQQEQIKINAKNAGTEEEKTKFNTMSQALNYFVKAKELGVDANMALKSGKELFGESIAVETLGLMGKSIMESKPQDDLDSQLKTQKLQMNERVLDMLGGQGGEGGSLPPGTTARAGNLTVPLNPPLTADESRIVGAGGIVNEATEVLIEAAEAGELSGLINQILVDVGNPLFTGDRKDVLISSMNALKGIIPFAKGGKQLTPFESKLLFRLLNTTGKSTETIIADMRRFAVEYDNVRRGIVGGTSAVQDLGSTRKRMVSDPSGQPITISGDSGEYTVEVE